MFNWRLFYIHFPSIHVINCSVLGTSNQCRRCRPNWLLRVKWIVMSRSATPGRKVIKRPAGERRTRLNETPARPRRLECSSQLLSSRLNDIFNERSQREPDKKPRPPCRPPTLSLTKQASRQLLSLDVLSCSRGSWRQQCTNGCSSDLQGLDRFVRRSKRTFLVPDSFWRINAESFLRRVRYLRKKSRLAIERSFQVSDPEKRGSVCRAVVMDLRSTWTSSVQLHRRHVCCRPRGKRTSVTALRTPLNSDATLLDIESTDDDSRCQVWPAVNLI